MSDGFFYVWDKAALRPGWYEEGGQESLLDRLHALRPCRQKQDGASKVGQEVLLKRRTKEHPAAYGWRGFLWGAETRRAGTGSASPTARGDAAGPQRGG